jgi:RimJ/RimL family protein N-acetyltransferase
VRLPFTTERLTVRLMRSADAAVVAAYRNDPHISEMQSWTLPYSEERASESLAEQDQWTDVTTDGWTMLGVEHDGALIGDLALRMSGGGHIAEIGYTLQRSAHGRGYAREAAGALVQRLFDEHPVHRVCASLSRDNRASMRVLEHIGLVRESTTKLTYLRRDGAWEDDLNYAVTREEFQQWRERPTTPPSDVALVEITEHNARRFLRLETHWSQRDFVAPMDASFADALAGESYDGHPVVPWFRGVEADGDPAGFVMLADVTDHHPEPYLWRLLIDRRHQRRGIGERVIELIIERTREQGVNGIGTSWVPALAGTPEPFYRRLGFEPTGEMDDDEVVARLQLQR